MSFGQARPVGLVGRSVSGQEVLDQNRNVLGSGAQRWDADREHAEAEIEIATKVPP